MTRTEGTVAAGAGRSGAARRSRRATWTSGPARPIVIGVGLAAIVGARWAATEQAAPALLVGALFGLALAGLAWTAGSRPAPIRPGAVLIGMAGAVALVGLAIGASRLAGLPLQVVPRAEFGPWALITIIVASAEELVLRGALFDAVEAAAGAAGDGLAGLVTAILVTSVGFALIHVPLYGWHVVPLDLGVGVLLAGLRLSSGSVAAPAIAHVVADLATWWV